VQIVDFGAEQNFGEAQAKPQNRVLPRSAMSDTALLVFPRTGIIPTENSIRAKKDEVQEPWRANPRLDFFVH
jgi:hypothetical protein